MGALGRFQIALPAGSLSFTLSPDGRNLAFIAPGLNGRSQTVWIRPMDVLEPRSLPGTENALTPPFWSPDSRFIAFWAGGKLKKIDVTGGLPQEIVCGLQRRSLAARGIGMMSSCSATAESCACRRPAELRRRSPQ